MLDLMHGLVRKGTIAGCDIVELAPSRDAHGLSALMAVRLISNLIGAMIRADQFGHKRGSSPQ
jgi:agmatinase